MSGRDFFDVAEKIIGVVEDDVLLGRLKHLYKAETYRAPEMRAESWRRLCMVLESELGYEQPDPGTWQSTVGEIIRGEA